MTVIWCHIKGAIFSTYSHLDWKRTHANWLVINICSRVMVTSRLGLCGNFTFDWWLQQLQEYWRDGQESGCAGIQMRMLAGIKEAAHTPLMFAAGIEVTAHLSIFTPNRAQLPSIPASVTDCQRQTRKRGKESGNTRRGEKKRGDKVARDSALPGPDSTCLSAAESCHSCGRPAVFMHTHPHTHTHQFSHTHILAEYACTCQPCTLRCLLSSLLFRSLAVTSDGGGVFQITG